MDTAVQEAHVLATAGVALGLEVDALQLQVLLLCIEQCLNHDSRGVLRILESLHHILAIEPLPSYRYLLEWMIARIYLRCPQTRSCIFDQLDTMDHHKNPKFLASLMKIGVMIAKTGDSEDFALY